MLWGVFVKAKHRFRLVILLNVVFSRYASKKHQLRMTECVGSWRAFKSIANPTRISAPMRGAETKAKRNNFFLFFYENSSCRLFIRFDVCLSPNVSTKLVIGVSFCVHNDRCFICCAWMKKKNEIQISTQEDEWTLLIARDLNSFNLTRNHFPFVSILSADFPHSFSNHSYRQIVCVCIFKSEQQTNHTYEIGPMGNHRQQENRQIDIVCCYTFPLWIAIMTFFSFHFFFLFFIHFVQHCSRPMPKNEWLNELPSSWREL